MSDSDPKGAEGVRNKTTINEEEYEGLEVEEHQVDIGEERESGTGLVVEEVLRDYQGTVDRLDEAGVEMIAGTCEVTLTVTLAEGVALTPETAVDQLMLMAAKHGMESFFYEVREVGSDKRWYVRHGHVITPSQLQSIYEEGAQRRWEERTGESPAGE